MSKAQIDFILRMMAQVGLTKGHWAQVSADGSVEHGPHIMKPGQ
jgi:hypothetical protein